MLQVLLIAIAGCPSGKISDEIMNALWSQLDKLLTAIAAQDRAKIMSKYVDIVT
jgi:hypothetical protein